MHGEIFSTTGVPMSQRRGAFQDKMNRLFSLGLDVGAGPDCPFETEMRAFASTLLRIASLKFSPHTTTRRETADAKEKASFILGLQRAGITTVSQDGRSAVIKPGDLFLIDTGRPFKLETGNIWTESFYVPPDAIREAFWQVDSLTAIAIRSESGAASMLRGMFQEIFELAPALDRSAESRVVSCALQVIELALTSLSGRLGSAPSRLDRYHQERIKSYIRENLRNPRLSPQTIAQGVGLSVRHLYDLLAGEPETLMRRIWKDRLRRSREDLLSTEHARRSISEIAYSWGFQDAAHFSRMFRSQFDVTPSALRRSVFESRGLKSINRRPSSAEHAKA